MKGILPGSLEEREYSKRVIRELRDYTDWVKFTSLPVYTWSSKCLVETREASYDCVALPYSPSVEVDLKPASIKILESPTKARELAGDEVVLVKYPESAPELKWLYYTISSRGAKLVVFFTDGDFVKADTVLGTPGFSFNPSTPPRVPAICVSSRLAKLVREQPATLRVKSDLGVGETVVVLAGINGPSEREVHITSYRDTIIGDHMKTTTSLLLRLASSLNKTSPPCNVILISTTAREVGDFQFTEYHVTWGLRYLLELLEARGDLSRVHVALALGPIHSEERIRITIHPLLKRAALTALSIAETNINLDYNHAQLESYIYLNKGIPAVTLTSLPYTWWCHNSTLNCSRHDLGTVTPDLAKRLLATILEHDYTNSPRELEDYIIGSLREASVEARSIVLRIRSLSRILSTRDYIREATRLGYSILYTACNYPFKVSLNADILVELSENSLRTLRDVLEECRGDLLIGTGDWYISAHSIETGSKKLFLRAFTEKIIKNRNIIIDNSITRYLCVSAFKGSNYGVEEYRNKQIRELQ